MSKKKVRGAVLWGILGGCRGVLCGGSDHRSRLLCLCYRPQPDLRLLRRLPRVSAPRPSARCSPSPALTSPPIIADQRHRRFRGHVADHHAGLLHGGYVRHPGHAVRRLRRRQHAAPRTATSPTWTRPCWLTPSPPAAGAVCGTSTVTTFVESSAGVAEGGRTGLASMATAALFFIAMFLVPRGPADPHLRLRRGPDLCGRADDVQRPQHRLGRSRRCRDRLCHRGVHAPDLQHLLWHRLRPDLLRVREDLHRQDQGDQRGHLDHQRSSSP